MSLTVTLNYDNGGSFSYDPTKIGFPGGTHAALLLVNGSPQTQNENISAATFDPTLLAYGSGSLHQLDQRPANATFYAAWSSMLDANWGNGALTVTPVNGAAIAGGVLDLSGSTTKYVTFDATTNAALLQQGTIEFQVTPEYSGTPSAIQDFFYTAASSAASDALVTIVEHYTDGNLYLLAFDQAAANVMVISAPWAPVSGTTYTIRATFDGTGGSAALFINGSQVASGTQTFTRAGAITFGAVGFRTDIAGANANFKIANLSVYSAVVTPPSPVLPATIYPLATATMPLFTYGGLGSLQGFVSLAATDANAPHYTFNGDWWNGTAWTASDGSYGEIDPAAVANANFAALTPVDTMQIDAIFPPSNVQASVSALSFQYIIQIYATDDPTIAPLVSTGISELLDFSAVDSASGSDGVGFVMRINGSPLWWNGTAWVTSNLSFAQSNTPAAVLANFATIPGLNPGVFLNVVAVLHSAAGTTTPTLTSLTLTYELYQPLPSPPPLCTVFGFLTNLLAIPPQAGAVWLMVTNPAPFEIDGVIVNAGITTLYCDARGEVQADFVITASLGLKMYFQIGYYDQLNTQQLVTLGWAEIPNQPTADLSTFVFTTQADN